MIKKELEKELNKLIGKALGQEGLRVNLDHPINETFGDFTANIALKVSKTSKQNPKEIANKLIEEFKKSEELKALGVTKIELAGPGFINFYLSQAILASQIQEIIAKKDKYGHSDLLSGKRVMVEFADPNPFKEFHIGHLRNISLGESLVRLQKALEADVWPVSYQGDVGLQVAKALWGLKKLGYDKKKLEESKLGIEDKVKVLAKAYVAGSKAYDESLEAAKEMVAMNVAIYNQDKSQPELLELWKAGRSWSLEYFESIYKRVGTKYARNYFESQVASPGRELVLKHIGDGVFERSEGAVIFDGERYGLHKRVFVTKGDYATYEAKDLYLAPLKHGDFEYDLSVILTGDEHVEYFRVVLKALSLIYPDLAAKTLNLNFGMVNLKGEKMTSRKGNVVTANELIDEAKEKVREIIKSQSLAKVEAEEIAEKVAVGAVKYFMLRSDKKVDIQYDVAESVSLDGNSGPYLQYTHARALSVLRKAEHEANFQFTIFNLNSNFKFQILNLGKEELSVLRTLYKYPEVVESAALNYSPHLVANFLFDLAQKFNLFYNNVSILGSQKTQSISTSENQKVGLSDPSDDPIIRGTDGLSVQKFRLSLTAATAQVIKNGLYLLGIEAPEKM